MCSLTIECVLLCTMTLTFANFKVFRTPEVTRVYISSFWDRAYAEIGRCCFVSDLYYYSLLLLFTTTLYYYSLLPLFTDYGDWEVLLCFRKQSSATLYSYVLCVHFIKNDMRIHQHVCVCVVCVCVCVCVCRDDTPLFNLSYVCVCMCVSLYLSLSLSLCVCVCVCA